MFDTWKYYNHALIFTEEPYKECILSEKKRMF